MQTLAVAKIEARSGRFDRVAVGPEGVKVGMGVQRPANVVVVVLAAVRNVADLAPRAAFVAADPHGHFAAGADRLGALSGRSDDPPEIVLDVDRAGRIIVVGGRDLGKTPLRSVPMSDGPPARIARRSGGMVRAGRIKDQRPALPVEIQIVDVDEPLFGKYFVKRSSSPRPSIHHGCG